MKNTEDNPFPPATQRIQQLINHYAQGNVSRFVKESGLQNVQKVNRLFNVDSRNGKYPTPSSTILDTIREAYPDVNPTWLFAGEGEMLQQKGVGQNMSNISQRGHGNAIGSKDVATTIRANNEEIVQMQKTIKELQKDKERLLNIIEKLSNR